jgi:hypothetical protein
MVNPPDAGLFLATLIRICRSRIIAEADKNKKKLKTQNTIGNDVVPRGGNLCMYVFMLYSSTLSALLCTISVKRKDLQQT